MNAPLNCAAFAFSHEFVREVRLESRQLRRGRLLRAVNAVVEPLERRRLLAAGVLAPPLAASGAGAPATVAAAVPLAVSTTAPNLDKSFGVGGVSTIDAFDQDSAKSVVVQSDGKIVVAGWSGVVPANSYDEPLANSITLIS